MFTGAKIPSTRCGEVGEKSLRRETGGKFKWLLPREWPPLECSDTALRTGGGWREGKREEFRESRGYLELPGALDIPFPAKVAWKTKEWAHTALWVAWISLGTIRRGIILLFCHQGPGDAWTSFPGHPQFSSCGVRGAKKKKSGQGDERSAIPQNQNPFRSSEKQEK